MKNKSPGMDMPKGWEKLKNSKVSFCGELIPVCKLMDDAANLMKEMAEALDDAVTYAQNEGAELPTVEKALKKFKEWK